MARVAVDTVVNVATHAIVMRVSLRLCVTGGAGKDRVVTGICMASSAHTLRSTVLNVEPGMVEGRAGPGDGGVAGRTCRWETSREMIRIRCACELRLMAGVAILRCTGEDVVDVAAGAGDADVRAGQREGRVVVRE